jgi:phosphate ABC transporter phosphate-binding protein
MKIFRPFSRVACVVCAWLFLFSVLPVPAQSAGNNHTEHSIFVAPLDGGNTNALRNRIIERLKKSGAARVVDDKSAADVVLQGQAVMWATGTVSNSLRSHGARQTIYQGYLSAELKNRSNQTVWSYLVTPSRFRTGNIVDDLADRISSKLLEAMREGITDTGNPAAKSSAQVALRAAGGTFPEPLYRRWFETFQQESEGAVISYDAVGSEAGIEELKAGRVDLAASDIPVQEKDMLLFPTVAGGVVPIYNLPDAGRGLKLTSEALAGIYSGTIRKWNDPRIQRWNSGAHLPDAEITVVHRSDGSGTTYVWTSYLALADAAWKSKVGARVQWPIGMDAVGNGGVAEQVAKTPNSIGYVELIYAIQHRLNYAAIRNPSGRFIKADLNSITAAAAEVNPGSAALLVLNEPGKDAYPISGFTWMLVPESGSDAQKRAAIAGFLRWMLTSGQKQCSSLGYAPLPHEMIAAEMQRTNALK